MFIDQNEAIGGTAAAKSTRKVAKHLRPCGDFRGNAALYKMLPPYAGQRSQTA